MCCMWTSSGDKRARYACRFLPGMLIRHMAAIVEAGVERHGKSDAELESAEDCLARLPAGKRHKRIDRGTVNHLMIQASRVAK